MKRQRWVVKVGSNVICNGGPLLLRAWMQQVSVLRRQGVDIIWVTSGAIATAVERTQFKNPKRTMAEKQALSAIGQPLLMDLYNEALHASGLLGAQVLLTGDDIKNRTRRTNLKTALNQLLSWDVVPILNENDATTTDEIKFGDNDSLSAQVAEMMSAHKLVLLTDVDGLYDRDPRRFPKAQLVPFVARVTPKVLASAGTGAGSKRGTGGMQSKLKAAQRVNKRGIEAWLLRGDQRAPLLDLFEGRATGTCLGGKKK